MTAAPEYVLDSQIIPASDMYALGCLLYAVHSKGTPPFRNHGSIGSLRSNVDNVIRLTGMESWDPDLKSW
jgi:SCY1-like protein 2